MIDSLVGSEPPFPWKDNLLVTNLYDNLQMKHNKVNQLHDPNWDAGNDESPAWEDLFLPEKVKERKLLNQEQGSHRYDSQNQIKNPSGSLDCEILRYEEHHHEASRLLNPVVEAKRKRYDGTEFSIDGSFKAHRVIERNEEEQADYEANKYKTFGRKRNQKAMYNLSNQKMKPTKSESCMGKPKRQGIDATVTWTRFTKIEEVILVGCILKRFFKKGSLTSRPDEDCWESIKESYDRAWHIYSKKQNCIKPQERSKASLARHFKFMKTKLSRKDRNMPDLKQYYLEWEKLSIQL